MDFTTIIPCKNKSPGVNTCEYIVLHHTGGGSFSSNLSILSGQGESEVSCHFLIGRKGEIAKIGDPKEIQWHVGESRRGEKTNMNRYSIGIEIIDDPKFAESKDRFTDIQRKKVRELVTHLMKTYNIGIGHILTHASLTREGSKRKELRDGKSPSRKVDANRSLRVFDGYNSFSEYRASFGTLDKKKMPLDDSKKLGKIKELLDNNSSLWGLLDDEDKKILSNTNEFFRNKYSL